MTVSDSIDLGYVRFCDRCGGLFHRDSLKPYVPGQLRCIHCLDKTDKKVGKSEVVP